MYPWWRVGSATAAAAGCRWAVNGGPFNMGDGACDAGAFVHNGTVCGTGGWVPMLASTIDGRWVVGTVDDSMGAQLAEAIPGFGWLVRDGAAVPGLNDSYVAPRTTAGVTKGGQVRRWRRGEGSACCSAQCVRWP